MLYSSNGTGEILRCDYDPERGTCPPTDGDEEVLLLLRQHGLSDHQVLFPQNSLIIGRQAMKCSISITGFTDIAAWVTRQAFTSNVSQDDLACRDSQEVFDWYRADWFFRDAGDLYFIPPAFHFWDGHLHGINGRHRAVLLSRHMEVFPMLLVDPATWPEDKLSEIVHNRLKDGETVELPDLPVKGTIER